MPKKKTSYARRAGTRFKGVNFLSLQRTKVCRNGRTFAATKQMESFSDAIK